jgi:hypothetical protein
MPLLENDVFSNALHQIVCFSTLFKQQYVTEYTKNHGNRQRVFSFHKDKKSLFLLELIAPLVRQKTFDAKRRYE